MKKTYLIIMPCLLLMAITRVTSQNILIGTTGGLDNTYTTGWELISSGVEENLFSVHFANPTHGFIGGALTRCLKSTNGGINWSPMAVPSYADFEAVWVVSSNDAYLGGWDSVYATHNDGQSWTGAYTTGTANYAVHELQFISPDDGFAFMTWSQMGVTTNGGNTWSLASGGGFEALDFFGGYMLDQNTGWAVGDLSILCKTTDGGISWIPYEWNGYLDFTGIQLWGVHATSELNAWIVADSGIIFRTTDGGNYWSRNTIAGPEDRLTDIYFINASTGYIVGYNGLIFKTTDGGDSWLQEPQLTNNNLNSVFFISEDLGWAVGDNGTILRYKGTNGVFDDPLASTNDLIIYPNPVKGKSSVSFNLSEKQKVKIEIRDISDRVLKTVFEGILAQGEHTISLEAPGFAGGVYLCHLNGEKENTSKRFIITK
jgi:photosystem II stability/assembly factor-like uncharacterized protein